MQTDTIYGIFNISTEEDFNKSALEVFKYQYETNAIYRQYAGMICKDISQIHHYTQIPFLPIEFFKTHKIISGAAPVQASFSSSGTTGQIRSYHHVTDLAIYEKSAIKCFESFYGNIEDYTILALLPSYLERKDSSLVWMTNFFISKSKFSSDCGFYLNDHSALLRKLKKLISDKSRKILILGVSFALLDLAEKVDFSFENVIVMETGGMKGQRKEIVREELHQTLKNKFHVSAIHSEYGMTEHLSQSYSKSDGIFKSPPWVKVLIREINDPLSLSSAGKSGGINIIDLANINSCSFIATQDIGKSNADGTFEVSGRFDNSETRGCNLMVT